MWIPFFGLLLGLIIGTVFTFSVPILFAKYLSIAALAALDSLLGGLRALMEDDFDGATLITGFITNVLLAAGLAYFGDRLGMDLYLAAVIAFGIRIFSNLGFIRRDILNKYRKKKSIPVSRLTREDD